MLLTCRAASRDVLHPGGGVADRDWGVQVRVVGVGARSVGLLCIIMSAATGKMEYHQEEDIGRCPLMLMKLDSD